MFDVHLERVVYRRFGLKRGHACVARVIRLVFDFKCFFDAARRLESLLSPSAEWLSPLSKWQSRGVTRHEIEKSETLFDDHDGSIYGVKLFRMPCIKTTVFQFFSFIFLLQERANDAARTGINFYGRSEFQ